MTCTAKSAAKIICVLSLAGALSGCLSAMDKQGLAGEYEQIIADFDAAGGYADRASDDEIRRLQWVCDAFFQTRARIRYRECIDRLMPMLPEESWGTTIHDYEATYRAQDAQLSIEVSDFDAARSAAEEAVQAFSQNEREELENIGHLALFLRVYKTLGLVAAFEADRQGAQDAVRTIEEASLAEPWGGLDSMTQQFQFTMKRDAVAAIYAALGDYEHTAEVLNQEFEVDSNFTTKMDAITTWGLSSSIDKLAMNLTKDYRTTLELPTHFLKAKANQEVGNQELAAQIYDQLLSTEVIKGFSEIYHATLYERGRIDLARGDRTSAIERFKLAVDEIERQRSSVATEAGKIGFVGNKQAVYRALIDALIDEGRIGEAFDYVERAKARALVDMLASKQSFGAEGSARRSTAAKLIHEIAERDARQQTFSEARFDELTSGTRGVAVSSAPEIPDRELASVISVSATDVSGIRGLLEPGETLVEYYGEGDELIAFMVTREAIRAFELPVPELAGRVQKFRRDLQDPESNDYRESGGWLYRHLIFPLADAGLTRSLIIVPHGPLHYLPFGALPDRGSFLVEKHDYRILPSASVMSFLGERQQAKDRLLVLGNPDVGNPALALPFAEREARAIGRSTERADTRVQRDATETAVKKSGARYSRLHLASHGIFDTREPLASRLLLAGDAMNDGSLTVSELYDLDLDVDLVTLSACETGLGEVTSGDDVVGFTRGFLFAGAQTIVSSLWQVDDQATMDLMLAFYAALRQEPPTEALRDAQLRLLRSQAAHPFYWAAFQVTGSNRI